MSIEDFIKERETPWSKVKDIKVNKDGSVSYTEVYDLKHPLCPIFKIDNDRKILTLNQSVSKGYFEMIYGSVEVLKK